MNTEQLTQQRTDTPQQLVIVQGGVCRTPIMLPPDAPPCTRQAAGELADVIAKVGGVRPEVLQGTPDPVPDHAIWVGFQPVLETLFPDLDFDFGHPEEILLSATTDHLVIAGRDRWDADALVVEPTSRNQQRITGRQWEYGTANAVYAFLRRYLDVLWLWPGELGEDIVRKKTIAFAPFEYRYHPPFRQRGTIFRQSALGDTRGHSHAWTRRQGLQLDSLATPGGHAFSDWWERFHEDHPEYFALQPDGTRSGYPAPQRPDRAKLCQSNPEVWEQWLNDVTEALREDPHQTVFNAAPNDSAGTGICMCNRCRAWDAPDGASYRYYWNDEKRDYVAMSDRYIRFTNRLARKLRSRFPNRDLRVLQFAYHCSTWPPRKTIPDDNVIISYIGNFPLTDEADRKEQRRRMAGWKLLAPAIVYRPNQWVYAGALGLPQVAPAKLIDDFHFLAENHCVGLFVDTTWEHWATTAPHYYLMGRLGWNPSQDGQALLDEYYQRGFGKAAEAIRAYWELMADEFGDMGYRERLDAVIENRFGPAVWSHAKQFLDRAAHNVASEPEIYQRRVAFVRAGLDYTFILFELLEALEQAGENPSDEQRGQIADDWKQIRKIADDHPHALNYRWLPNRMARKGRYVPPDMD